MRLSLKQSSTAFSFGGLLALLSFAMTGCSVPDSPVQVGASKADVLEGFAPDPAYSVSCGGVTYFPDYPRYEACQSEDAFILIFRRGGYQYAYTIQDGRVVAVSVSNYTVTYP